MKNYTMFNYDFLFGDHFAKISNQAKLYYINLNFFADNGFVANPLQVLDSLGYDKGVFNELVKNGELLTLPDRSEIFIASYFIHNKGMNCYAWKGTRYAVYWEDKLYVKKNGVVKFDPEGNVRDKLGYDPLDKIVEPKKESLDATEKQSDELDVEKDIDIIGYFKGENENEKL